MRPARVRAQARLRGGIALAVALAFGSMANLVAVPGTVVLAASASPGLTIVGAATYDVVPEEGRVAVTVALTATNHRHDTTTKRFFFRTGYITVLPNTADFKLSASAGKPKVTVSSSTATYTNLKLDLGANLAAGKSVSLTLTFNVRDPGGAPDRPVRISPSLVSFAAWAIATPSTKGATVGVTFPAGYNVLIGRGPLIGPVRDGSDRDVWLSDPLDAPLDFVADISADRPSDYAETARTVDMAGGPASILLQAWPDDAAWRDRVGDLVARALPVLEREIGVPWPDPAPLAVHEALVRATGGYAGIFDPADRRIDIAYAASDAVVLHELAHAWFNGRLVGDRWIAEGFASYYAQVAASELGVDPELPAPVTPHDPDPLNDWGPDADGGAALPAWGYPASLELAETIASRTSAAALRTVWADAAMGIGGYQAEPGGTETAGPPDWRGLLDLLEDVTGRSFADLWRSRVARPGDLPLLADRAVTRGYYLRSVALAGEWHLPPAARQAMRSWRFDIARELLAAADAVQAQRVVLESTSAAAALTLPDTLRNTFEGQGGAAAAAVEAAAEQATVDAIAAAQAARPTEHGVGERMIIGVGLVLADPDRDLATARSSLTAGDLEGAYVAAESAQAAWLGAARTGRARIVSTVLLLLALAVFASLFRRGQRGRPVRSGGSA